MIDLALTLPLASFDLVVKAHLEGPATAVLGPSGAGKSSLLEAIAGVRLGARGRIVLGDVVLLDDATAIDLPPQARHVGWVPQEGALFPHLDVARNLSYGLRPHGNATHLDEIVRVLDLAPLLARSIGTLSGGERQRVALGRALVPSPRLLLLDEPLAGIDVARKDRVLPYLARVLSQWSIPSLYVTHHLDEARALAGDAIGLRDGRLVARGTIDEVTAALTSGDR